MTNKEQLKQLARDIKFESVMFADEFKHSKKEELRYTLWLSELQLWIKNNYKIIASIDVDCYNEPIVYFPSGFDMNTRELLNMNKDIFDNEVDALEMSLISIIQNKIV